MKKRTIIDLISVVIPTYNRRKTLQRAVASVLNQTYQNLEIIIVDDHSNDDTYEKYKRHQDNRITIIRHASNKGGADARNTGIKAARGEFITFLDSDDEWLRDKLESQVQHFYKYANSNSILFSSILLDDGKTKTVWPKNTAYAANTPISEYIFVNDGLVSTDVLFMRTKVAKEIMFTPGLRKHQDYDFVLRAHAAGKNFIFINQISAIWHNAKNTERIGMSHDYLVSYGWARKNRSLFTDSSYRGFILRDVVPQVWMNKFSPNGCKFLMSLLLKHEIEFKTFLTSLIRIFVVNPRRFFPHK